MNAETQSQDKIEAMKEAIKCFTDESKLDLEASEDVFGMCCQQKLHQARTQLKYEVRRFFKKSFNHDDETINLSNKKIQELLNTIQHIRQIYSFCKLQKQQSTLEQDVKKFLSYIPYENNFHTKIRAFLNSKSVFSFLFSYYTSSFNINLYTAVILKSLSFIKLYQQNDFENCFQNNSNFKKDNIALSDRNIDIIKIQSKNIIFKELCEISRKYVLISDSFTTAYISFLFFKIEKIKSDDIRYATSQKIRLLCSKMKKIQSNLKNPLGKIRVQTQIQLMSESKSVFMILNPQFTLKDNKIFDHYLSFIQEIFSRKNKFHLAEQQFNTLKLAIIKTQTTRALNQILSAFNIVSYIMNELHFQKQLQINNLNLNFQKKSFQQQKQLLKQENHQLNKSQKFQLKKDIFFQSKFQFTNIEQLLKYHLDARRKKFYTIYEKIQQKNIEVTIQRENGFYEIYAEKNKMLYPSALNMLLYFIKYLLGLSGVLNKYQIYDDELMLKLLKIKAYQIKHLAESVFNLHNIVLGKYSDCYSYICKFIQMTFHIDYNMQLLQFQKTVRKEIDLNNFKKNQDKSSLQQSFCLNQNISNQIQTEFLFFSQPNTKINQKEKKIQNNFCKSKNYQLIKQKICTQLQNKKQKAKNLSQIIYQLDWTQNIYPILKIFVDIEIKKSQQASFYSCLLNQIIQIRNNLKIQKVFALNDLHNVFAFFTTKQLSFYQIIQKTITISKKKLKIPELLRFFSCQQRLKIATFEIQFYWASVFQPRLKAKISPNNNSFQQYFHQLSKGITVFKNKNFQDLLSQIEQFQRATKNFESQIQRIKMIHFIGNAAQKDQKDRNKQKHSFLKNQQKKYTQQLSLLNLLDQKIFYYQSSMFGLNLNQIEPIFLSVFRRNLIEQSLKQKPCCSIVFQQLKSCYERNEKIKYSELSSVNQAGIYKIVLSNIILIFHSFSLLANSEQLLSETICQSNWLNKIESYYKKSLIYTYEQACYQQAELIQSSIYFYSMIVTLALCNVQTIQSLSQTDYLLIENILEQLGPYSRMKKIQKIKQIKNLQKLVYMCLKIANNQLCEQKQKQTQKNILFQKLSFFRLLIKFKTLIQIDKPLIYNCCKNWLKSDQKIVRILILIQKLSGIAKSQIHSQIINIQYNSIGIKNYENIKEKHLFQLELTFENQINNKIYLMFPKNGQQIISFMNQFAQKSKSKSKKKTVEQTNKIETFVVKKIEHRRSIGRTLQKLSLINPNKKPLIEHLTNLIKRQLGQNFIHLLSQKQKIPLILFDQHRGYIVTTNKCQETKFVSAKHKRELIKRLPDPPKGFLKNVSKNIHAELIKESLPVRKIIYKFQLQNKKITDQILWQTCKLQHDIINNIHAFIQQSNLDQQQSLINFKYTVHLQTKKGIQNVIKERAEMYIKSTTEWVPKIQSEKQEQISTQNKNEEDSLLNNNLQNLFDHMKKIKIFAAWKQLQFHKDQQRLQQKKFKQNVGKILHDQTNTRLLQEIQLMRQEHFKDKVINNIIKQKNDDLIQILKNIKISSLSNKLQLFRSKHSQNKQYKKQE